MRMPKRTAIAVTAAAAIAVGLLGTVPAAAAENQAAPTAAAPNSVHPNSQHDSSDVYGSTGRCFADICLYYNSYEAGAVVSFDGSNDNLAGYTYDDPGEAGDGQAIQNNAASAENQGSTEACVWVNHGFTGDHDCLDPGSYGQLYYAYNNEDSVQVF